MSEENTELTLDKLRQMAEQHDGATEPEYVANLPDMDKPYIVKAEPKEPESVDVPEAEKSESDKLSEGPPKVEPEDTEPDAPPPEVDDSALEKREAAGHKLEKSEKRLNEAWRKVNAEKEANAKDKAELEELRGTLNDRAQPEAYVDSDGNTAEDYESAARNFELEGQAGLAEAARKQAQSVQDQADVKGRENADASFTEGWGKSFDEAARSYPELLDADSSFRKAVNGLLLERPVLAKYTGGILDAADIVAMQVRAGESATLQEQIDSLSSENEGLKSKLSIGGSDPAGVPIGQKMFNEMAPEEQFAELQRKAAEADAGRVY